MEKPCSVFRIFNLLYEMLCAVWYHLYNLKNVKNAHGGVLLLLKLQVTKSNTPPWAFLTFFNCTNGTKLRKASHISNQSINLESLMSWWVFPHKTNSAHWGIDLPPTPQKTSPPSFLPSSPLKYALYIGFSWTSPPKISKFFILYIIFSFKSN